MIIKKRGCESTIQEVFLRNIGAKNITEVNQWFLKSYRGEYKLYDAKKFVSKILPYRNRKIRLVGDYDVDGISALYILITGLRKAGFTKVSYRIPTRQEGFGISTKIIEECLRDGIELIITCDNGIAEIEPISLAKRNGISVIVTDHHQPKKSDGKIVLPNADLIINPNAIENSSDYVGYCGAGICYKLMCELNKNDSYIKHALQIMAAIATIADVVQLREENYVIVKNGLKKLENYNLLSSGMIALLTTLGITSPVTSKSIAFKLAPCLNAGERMYPGGARDILNLLLYNGPLEKALDYAKKCIDINEKRKICTKKALEQAHKILEEKGMSIPLVLYIPNAKEGILGIIANKLSDIYKVPSIVFTDGANKDELKGSGRNYGDYDLKGHLDMIAHHILKYGGHKPAAGMTIAKDSFNAFKDAIINVSHDFKVKEDDTAFYDIEIEASQMPKAMEEIEKYEPFGNGNNAIKILAKNFTAIPNGGKYCKFLGSENSVVKISSKNGDAISFNLADSFRKKTSTPIIMNAVGILNKKHFMGKTSIQLEFEQFVEVKRTLKRTTLADKILKIS